MSRSNKNVIVDGSGNPIRVGDWNLKERLGSGGFGIVMLWTNKVTSESIAIKKCRWKLETHLTKKQQERWIAEVSMMKAIQNENIVKYVSAPKYLESALLASEASELPILPMEYCSLGNLRSMLVKPEHCCGFPEREVVNVLADISSALRYLHGKDITHRDVKPENIVLQHCAGRQSGIIYKIIDLGYAKELDNGTISFVGTLQYLAPEMFEKQRYTKSVDYWSFGITAFEIICGIRPFLPTFQALQSFRNIRDKTPDVISIQLTHTGDIKSSRELPKENHINMCLQQNMEAWLRLVLQYDPERRGVVQNEAVDVFESLQRVLQKKVITVFSVYTYEFYSYEINESTLYSTLQDWIARDVKVSKSEQYLIPSRAVQAQYALDLFDERDGEASLFVFKKNASINTNVRNNLPMLIKILFLEIKTEFKCGTLKLLHAHVIYFVSQEVKHVNALMSGIEYLSNFLQYSFSQENELLLSTQNLLRVLLLEIELYNHLEISLGSKVYKDSNCDKLNEYLLEYKEYMHQLGEIIDTVNKASYRHKNAINRNYQLQHLTRNLLHNLKQHDFNMLLQEAKSSYEEILEKNPVKNLTVGIQLVNVVSMVLKCRETVLSKLLLHNFIKAAMCYYKELQKLLACLSAVKQKVAVIRQELRQNITQRLQVSLEKKPEALPFSGDNAAKIMEENIALRYGIEDIMNASFLKYKKALHEIKNGLGECQYGLGGDDSDVINVWK